MTHIDRCIRALFVRAPAHRHARMMVPVLFDWTGDPAPLIAAGFRIGSYQDGIVSAELPLTKIEQVHALGIPVLEMGGRLKPTLDLSRASTGVKDVAAGTGLQRPYTGKGVIVGIVDSGIDYSHPAFLGADGKSRILYLWDQNESLQVLKAAKHRKFRGQLPRQFVTDFQYGVEYTKADLDAALAAPRLPSGNPAHLLVVRHRDRSSHGTHVAGIAAGNGRRPDGAAPTAYVGMAPEADIIVVSFARSIGPLGADPKLRDAIRYIASRAAQLNRNCVINLSLGLELLPGDGKTRVERTIERIVDGTAPGTTIVLSAGNSNGLDVRARGSVPRNGRTELKLQVAKGAKRAIDVHVWYGRASATHRFGITVTPPRGKASAEIGANGLDLLDFGNGNTGVAVGETDHPDHLQHAFTATLDPGKAPPIADGEWTITLIDRSTGGGTAPRPFDAEVSERRGAKFTNNMLGTSTINTPATARKAIVVASHVTRTSNTGTTGPATPAIAATSSRGPTPDGRPAPTLAAPGEWIISTVPQAPNKQPYGPKRGTSMAAPHVTGAVALMLEAKPTLPNADIARILQETARKPSAGLDPNLWGSGLLDVLAAVKRAEQA